MLGYLIPLQDLEITGFQAFLKFENLKVLNLKSLLSRLKCLSRLKFVTLESKSNLRRPCLKNSLSYEPLFFYIKIVSFLEKNRYLKDYFWLTLPDFTDALLLKRKLLQNYKKNQKINEGI